MISRGLDWIAARLGCWALRRLFGADCETDVRDDFPGEDVGYCASCDAKRLIEIMSDERFLQTTLVRVSARDLGNRVGNGAE